MKTLYCSFRAPLSVFVLLLACAGTCIGEEKQQPLDELLNYLNPHADHMAYAKRLSLGRSIGSGQVEGACKNLVGRRLKQTGARWKVRRVNRMAGLCCVMYSDNWQNYWNTLVI